MKLQDLSPNERNPRKITDAQLEMLKKSLDEFGDLGCVVWNEQSGKLVGGHQRLKALPPDADIVVTQTYDPPSRTGTTAEGHVVIAGEKFKYRKVSWPQDKETAALISANKQGGEFDYPILNDLLLELDELNYDMELTGFDEKELEKQLTYVSEHTRGGDKDESEPSQNEEEKEQVRVQNIQIPEIINGDCLDVMKTLQADHYDSLVTDPPAGISFMGKDWDDDKGGSKQWIAWMKDVMSEALRILKPGAHGLVWAIPRTSHWTATALEDAGFEIRDVVVHLFGSGFPKSLDISKAIDKMNGHWRGKNGGLASENSAMSGGNYLRTGKGNPITTEAEAWSGWGTSLKPASEHWLLVRKPLREDTVAKNVLKYGTGGINIEASRIGDEPRTNTSASASAIFGSAMDRGPSSECVGRFPANLVLSHNPDCELLSEGKRLTTDFATGEKRERDFGPTYDEEIPETWACTEGCPVPILDGQSGQFAGELGSVQNADFAFHSGIGGRSGTSIDRSKMIKDFGGASRFFYCSKPSKREKNTGLETFPVRQPGGLQGRADGTLGKQTTNQNFHPTVKSIKLMTYFIKMVTPPGGTVLDPFCGSGSTGVAAGRNGFKFLGIEKDPSYANIASHRFKHEIEMTEAELEDLEGEERASY